MTSRSLRVALTAALLSIGLAGCTKGPLSDGRQPHVVSYRAQGSGGEASGPYLITYTNADGKRAKDSVAGGFAPEWSIVVTVAADVPMVFLDVNGSSLDTDFRMSCVIEVDGTEVATGGSPYGCMIQYRFPMTAGSARS